MAWYKRFYLKIFLSIYMSILLTILTLAVVSSFIMTDILKESAYAELRVDNSTLKKQLDLNLSFVETTINQLAESHAVIQSDMDKTDHLSQRLIEQVNLISQIYVMDSRGMQIYKSSYIETMGDRSDRAYFQNAVKGESNFSDVIISRSTKIPITVYACPIYRNGKIDGVIGTSIDLSYLSELSSTLRSSNDSYGFVIDLEGHVIGHPDSDVIAGMEDFTYMPMVVDVLKGKTGIGEYVYEGVDKLVAYTPSEKSGWGVLVQIPRKEAFNTITIFNRLFFLAAFLILMVSFLVVLRISHRLHRPVNKIIEMIDRIEQNQELDQVPIPERNEFGIIQDKLLSMDKTIRKYYNEQEERVEQRTAELQQTLSELENTKTELETANKKLNSISLTDELTNLPNRRALNEYLKNLASIAQRLDLRLAVMMIDIDYFKNYNDAFGHQKGDACLVQVGECLSSQLHRKVDFLARYGGEEFLVCLGDIDNQGARDMAQKLCRGVADLKIPGAAHTGSRYVTVSIGISWTSSLNSNDIQNLIYNADSNLYLAKETGRNRIV